MNTTLSIPAFLSVRSLLSARVLLFTPSFLAWIQWRLGSESLSFIDSRATISIRLLLPVSEELEEFTVTDSEGRMISPGLNLVMTVIGFAVSTMFIIFVCTRLICARIQLRASRRSFPTASRSDLSIMERGIHGLEPVLLSSFPTKKFGDQFTHGEDMQCAVCLSEYQEKDVLRVLPYCGHAFHVNCVDIWLRQHTTCPVCRISLRDYPNGKRTLQNSQTASMRPLDPQGNYDSDSYLYHQVGQDFSTTTTGNRRMHQLNSEPSGIDESISALPPVNCSVKVTTDHELEGKYKESPSHSE